jgi:4-azaleucine resistance transporter AzlC
MAGMSTYAVLKKAFRHTVPVLFGYVPIGVAFGFLLTKSGYFYLYAVLMSVIIYSGATQFLAIGFFLHNATTVEIAVTTLLLNLRHSFFGLSLIRRFSGIPYVKPYLIFALTDETYALLTSVEEPDPATKSRYYFFVSLFNHLYWIFGTLAGALLGHTIAVDLKGLDFALTALFVVLTVEQYRKVRSLKPFIIALIVGISSLVFVAPQYLLLISILSGTALLLAVRRGH